LTKERSPDKAKPDAEGACSAADAPDFVLRESDCSAVFDAAGDMYGPPSVSEDVPGKVGLYFRETRYRSHSVLRINGVPPVLPGSSVSVDNVEFRADLTNRPSPMGRTQTCRPGLLTSCAGASFMAACAKRSP
jgi:hypothetical protein